LGALAAALVLAGSAIGGDAASAAADSAPVVRLALPEGELALGRATAPLTMIEFTDYQCPYCRSFQAAVWPKLKSEWIDTGKLRYIARDLPLAIHAAAAPAAEAAHCAGDQGKFWEMHAALLGGAADLTAGGIGRRAHALGLDLARFDECVARGKYAGVIRAHEEEANMAGIDGTPGFVVGRAAHGELTGVRVEGALPYEEFDALLRELLAAR
jgi:protein-disulfide isomerase